MIGEVGAISFAVFWACNLLILSSLFSKKAPYSLNFLRISLAVESFMESFLAALVIDNDF